MKPQIESKTASEAEREAEGAGTGTGRLWAVGVSGSLLAASGSAFGIAQPATSAPDVSGIRDRIALIQQRLADPATAADLAGRLRIDRDGEFLAFANFNNWDNGWNNQGFNNY